MCQWPPNCSMGQRPAVSVNDLQWALATCSERQRPAVSVDDLQSASTTYNKSQRPAVSVSDQQHASATSKMHQRTAVSNSYLHYTYLQLLLWQLLVIALNPYEVQFGNIPFGINYLNISFDFQHLLLTNIQITLTKTDLQLHSQFEIASDNANKTLIITKNPQALTCCFWKYNWNIPDLIEHYLQSLSCD